jgi:hypothetical protein
MARKPVSPPLSVSQSKIEFEKLAVLKRTEMRIAAMEIAAKPTSTRIALALPVLVLIAYTAYNFCTKCECTCNV